MKTKPSFMLIVLAIVTLLGLAGCSGLGQSADVVGSIGNTTVLAQPERPSASNTVAQAALSGTLEEIYNQVSPSVVHIQVVQKASDNSISLPEIPGFPNLPDLPQSNTPVRSEGTGFVWDKEGHIVTNNHVIDGADKITVGFADGRVVDASVVGADRDSDLAVLMVEVPSSDLMPVSLADSTTLQVGDLAIAIGNPFGQEGTMTVGIISALGRLLPVESADMNAPRYNIPDVIQTDAAINPGNSGGVLLNDKGEVIGVTSAIISAVRSSSGVGFAIPSAIVQQVVPALISDGHYDHPYVGISGTSLTPDLAEQMDLPADQRGALVIEVMPDSPADKADLVGSDKQVEIDGVQTQVGGDVITAVDGSPVHNIDDLITYLYRYGKVGEKVSLTILRDGDEQTVEVTLQARPRTDTQTTDQVSAEQGADKRAWLGITGLTVNGDLAAAMDLDQNQGGVLIQQIEQGSPADDAGLRGSFKPSTVNGVRVLLGGDIIIAADGQPVANIHALQDIVNQAQPDDHLALTILRDGQERELTVTLGERAD